jgi:alkyl hydroperoxide reductase subunit AhpC
MTARVTKEAPDFSAKAVADEQFEDIKLAQYRGRYVCLFFYPLDFTFVCPTEIIAFSDKVAEFEKRNCQVLGCSVDSHYTHLAWIKTPRIDGGLGPIKYPLIADLTKQISKDYGVLLDDGSVALRGLFIIDTKGVVRHMLVNDLQLGRSTDEALRVLDALQFVEKHGDLCPANWRPGSLTMKADPRGSREYFQRANAR